MGSSIFFVATHSIFKWEISASPKRLIKFRCEIFACWFLPVTSSLIEFDLIKTKKSCSADSRTPCFLPNFSDRTHSDSCQSCPANAICSTQGVTEYCNADENVFGNSCSRILPSCTGNQHYFDQFSDYTSNSCEDCPMGKTCPPSGNTDCPVGQYSDGDGDCQNWVNFVGVCPTGMYAVPNSGSGLKLVTICQ